MAYIRYEGGVTVDEILKCIKIEYNITELNRMNKRLIDFRDAKVIYDKENNSIRKESARIRDELNTLQDDGFIEAILIDTPDETAFFFLYAHASHRIKKDANCFSTLKGALKYLDVEMSDDEQKTITDNMIRIEC